MIIVIAAVGVIVAGCGSGSPSSTSGTTAAARPSTPATLEILAPGPNQHTARTVDVDLKLDDARVAASTQVGGTLRPDLGHIHLSVDGKLVAMPMRLRARLPPLPPGNHTLQAEFVATDHLPFSNRVVAAVTFRVV